jgi:hypothetical protein
VFGEAIADQGGEPRLVLHDEDAQGLRHLSHATADSVALVLVTSTCSCLVNNI